MIYLLIRLFIKDYKNTENPAVRTAYGKLAGWVGIFCNIILFGIKYFVGSVTRSISITADAINNLSDAGSSIISLIGFKLAGKPADKEHPYGHGRYEYVSALIVSVIVFYIGLELFKTSIDKVMNPSLINMTPYATVVLIISIIVKLYMCLYNYLIGKKIESKTLKAAAADSRNDIISTTAVLIALYFNKKYDANIDGLIGVGVSLFIIISGFNLIRKTINPLLGLAPDKELVDYIQHKIMSYPGVLGTHDLIIHDYGPGRCFASVHVEVAAEDEILETHDCIDNIERDFFSEDNINLIIHMDPIVTADEIVSDLRTWLSKEIKLIDPLLSIHDVRLVPGNTHTNIIFDCVVPDDVMLSYDDIRERITNKINKKFDNYYTAITFDSSYAPVQSQNDF